MSQYLIEFPDQIVFSLGAKVEHLVVFIIFQLEKSLDIFSIIAINSFHSRWGEAHCNDIIRDKRKIEVKAIFFVDVPYVCGMTMQ